MSKRKRTEFGESLLMNNYTWRQYFDRLQQLAMVMFEWEGLPESVDVRFLERTLFNKGDCVFFKDNDLSLDGTEDGTFLVLPSSNYGRYNVYNIPDDRRAYANNGYNKDLTNKDSVIIYNNYLRTNNRLDVEMFAKRLYNIDRAIDINVNAQKTPILLLCDEKERLTYLNMYKEYDGNAPVIKGTSGLDLNGFQVLQTGAPFVATQLYELKTNIWNEALTYLGIVNVSFQKKERMVTDEVNRTLGGTYASRYSRLLARQEACEQINKMFGLNVSVKYRDEIEPTSMTESEPDNDNREDGDKNE